MKWNIIEDVTTERKKKFSQDILVNSNVAPFVGLSLS